MAPTIHQCELLIKGKTLANPFHLVFSSEILKANSGIELIEHFNRRNEIIMTAYTIFIKDIVDAKVLNECLSL